MTRETSHTETQRTVEEYLRGCVGFDIEDNAIATILEDRGIAPGTPVKGVDTKAKGTLQGRPVYVVCQHAEHKRKRGRGSRDLETQGGFDRKQCLRQTQPAYHGKRNL